MANLDRGILRKLPEMSDPVNVFAHLEEEVKLRLSKIDKVGKAGPVKRIGRKVARKFRSRKSTIENDIYGELISKHYPLKKVQDAVDKLQIDPTDSPARIALTEPFTIKGIKTNLLVYREVLIHATMELHSENISSKSVNIATLAQKKYLEKFVEFLMEEIKEIQEKMARHYSSGDHGSMTKQIQDVKQSIFVVKEFNNILKSKQCGEEFETNLQDFLTNPVDRSEINKCMSPILNAMIVLPLSHDMAAKWVEALKKVLPQTPMGFFYESRLNRLYGKIFLEIYASGDITIAKQTAQYLLSAWNAINSGLSYVGSLPKTKIEKAYVREYALVCFVMSQEFPRLGLKPPSNHKKKLQDAIERLGPLTEDPGVKELQTALGRAMAQQDEVDRKAAQKKEKEADA